jgi:hypothetical protein
MLRIPIATVRVSHSAFLALRSKPSIGRLQIARTLRIALGGGLLSLFAA